MISSSSALLPCYGPSRILSRMVYLANWIHSRHMFWHLFVHFLDLSSIYTFTIRFLCLRPLFSLSPPFFFFYCLHETFLPHRESGRRSFVYFVSCVFPYFMHPPYYSTNVTKPISLYIFAVFSFSREFPTLGNWNPLSAQWIDHFCLKRFSSKEHDYF